MEIWLSARFFLIWESSNANFLVLSLINENSGTRGHFQVSSNHLTDDWTI